MLVAQSSLGPVCPVPLKLLQRHRRTASRILNPRAEPGLGYQADVGGYGGALQTARRGDAWIIGRVGKMLPERAARDRGLRNSRV